MSKIESLIGEQCVVVGENMRLRQFQPKDARSLLRLHLEPSMTRWLLDDVDLDNLAIVTKFIRGLRRLYASHQGLGIWAFERFASKYTRSELQAQGAMKLLSDSTLESLQAPKWQLQGWFNLTPVPDQPQKIELGSRLHQSAWGQHIACSVGEQLVNYAHDILDISTLYLNCHPSNRPALYCAAYLGFKNPEQVRFLGLPALSLSATPGSVGTLCEYSSSTRRRRALSLVKQWARHDEIAAT